MINNKHRESKLKKWNRRGTNHWKSDACQESNCASTWSLTSRGSTILHLQPIVIHQTTCRCSFWLQLEQWGTTEGVHSPPLHSSTGAPKPVCRWGNPQTAQKPNPDCGAYNLTEARKLQTWKHPVHIKPDDFLIPHSECTSLYWNIPSGCQEQNLLKLYIFCFLLRSICLLPPHVASSAWTVFFTLFWECLSKQHFKVDLPKTKTCMTYFTNCVSSQTSKWAHLTETWPCILMTN